MLECIVKLNSDSFKKNPNNNSKYGSFIFINDTDKQTYSPKFGDIRFYLDTWVASKFKEESISEYFSKDQLFKIELQQNKNNAFYSVKKIYLYENNNNQNNLINQNQEQNLEKNHYNISASYNKDNLPNKIKIEDFKFKKETSCKEITINESALFKDFNKKIKCELFEEEFKLKVDIIERNNTFEIKDIKKIEKEQDFYIYNEIIDILKEKNILKEHNHKFVRKNNKYNPYIILNKFSDGNAGAKKKKILQNFVELFENSSENIYNDLCKRQEKTIKSFNPKTIKMKTNWRLIIGLGSESVYENSITLHHVYGIPYIPATSLKGSIRSYAINNYFDSIEKNALKCNIFTTIFGDENNQGNILFFDAFPEKKPTLDVDIMNNHYQDYYNNNKPPYDYYPPNPLSFLTVKDTNFTFYIADNPAFKIKANSLSCKNCNNCELLNLKTNFLDLTEELLKNALQDGGIGAKTSSGYGYMMYYN